VPLTSSEACSTAKRLAAAYQAGRSVNSKQFCARRAAWQADEAPRVCAFLCLLRFVYIRFAVKIKMASSPNIV